jgi:hypothetical protein
MAWNICPRRLEADMEARGDRIVARPTEARAGVTGQGVRYVLIYSTLGVIAAFAIVLFYFFV